MTKVSVCLVLLFFCCTQLSYRVNCSAHAATLDKANAWLPLETAPINTTPVDTVQVDTGQVDTGQTFCLDRLHCVKRQNDNGSAMHSAAVARLFYHAQRKQPPKAQWQPGYKYYLIDRLGLFDMSHIYHGKRQMEEVLQEIHSGYVRLSFVTQESLTTGQQFRITGFYRVRQNLSPQQLTEAALGIAMDFEHLVEAHQTPGSSYSLEDLPSDYIGYFLALHPHWDAEELLIRLDADQQPVAFNKVTAHLYKSFQRNQEFRPIPKVGGSHASWPRLLYMPAAGPWSGYWTRVMVIVTPDDRVWWQRWSDWGLKAYDVML